MFGDEGDREGVGSHDDPLSARLTAAVDGLAGDDPSRLSFAAQRARLHAVHRQIERLQAEGARLLDTAHVSGALADDGATTPAAWLRRNAHLTPPQAAARASAGRLLAGLPVVGAAFRAGDIGIAHMVQIDRLCADVGFEQVAAVDADLAAAAVRLRDVGEFTRLCKGWRYALRPDAADAGDARAHDNRKVFLSPTLDGVMVLNGTLGAEAGATLATAINAYMRPDPAGTPPELRRSIAARRADALEQVARVALAGAPDVAGARPQVVLRIDASHVLTHPNHPAHHDGQDSDDAAGADSDDAAGTDVPGRDGRVAGSGDVDGRGGGVVGESGGVVDAAGLPTRAPTLDWAGAVGPGVVERILGDCSIVRVVTNGASRPLDIGTATRVWPVGVRRAITERDRGCRFDPCDRPAAWCDIDHVDPVTGHGPTAEHNGILLCRWHHRAKRRDGWWPRLDVDGTVIWTHADGRVRIDHPPHTVDDEVATLLHATSDRDRPHPDTTTADNGSGWGSRGDGSDPPQLTSEPPARYDTSRAPPRQAA